MAHPQWQQFVTVAGNQSLPRCQTVADKLSPSPATLCHWAGQQDRRRLARRILVPGDVASVDCGRDFRCKLNTFLVQTSYTLQFTPQEGPP